LADAPPRIGRLVELGDATADRRPGRLGQARDPADPAVAQRPGRRTQQQPPPPLGQMRRDQGEGRCQHLIQVHTRKLLQPPHTWQSHQAGTPNLIRPIAQALETSPATRGSSRLLAAGDPTLVLLGYL
jgi:hypothetical protein